MCINNFCIAIAQLGSFDLLGGHSIDGTIQLTVGKGPRSYRLCWVL